RRAAVSEIESALSTHCSHTHGPRAAVQRNNLGLLRRVSRPPRTACDHPLLNHLLSALPQRLRDREAQRLCGFQVDHQLELGWLLDGDVGGLRTLENLVNEARCAAPMPRVG